MCFCLIAQHVMRAVALRIEIHHQGALSLLCTDRREIYRDARFADPALLIEDYMSHGCLRMLSPRQANNTADRSMLTLPALSHLYDRRNRLCLYARRMAYGAVCRAFGAHASSPRLSRLQSAHARAGRMHWQC